MKLRFSSTGIRYFTALFVGFCVVIFVFLIIVTNHIEKILLSQVETDVKHQTIIAETIFKDLVSEQNIKQLQSVVNDMAKDLGVRITVIDTTGMVLADSDQDPKTMDNHLSRPEVIMALAQEFGYATRYSHTLGIDLLYVAKKFGNEKTDGIIRFSIPLIKIKSFNQKIKVWIYLAGLILLGFSLLIAYLSSVAFRRPMREISFFTQNLAAGNLESRLLSPAKGEIAEIYKNLNIMAEELQNSFSTISRERDILAGVLLAMAEGVIVLDESGKIIIANASFQKTFTSEYDPIGKNAWEIIRNKDFVELIDECKKTKRPQKKEINLSDRGKTYFVSCYYMATLSGWAFIFDDVTEAKNLERIKADFVTNLSHELRTPLTAMKGFLETIDDPDINEPARKKFLKIVRHNTERMINLVSDLLTLSDIERMERKIVFEKFDLNELTENIILLFTKEAVIKGLDLQFNKRDIPEFNGDHFMIEQLLVNLISNAIRFTEHGKVSLDINFDSNNFLITVTDTGIGIPEPEIPRIFERFYTIDKARSREKGGTGLGLAIVKHIIQSHKGEIKIESRIGQGSKFTVILPKLAPTQCLD